MVIVTKKSFDVRGKKKNVSDKESSDSKVQGEVKVLGLCLSEGLVIFRFVPLRLQPGNHYPAVF